MPIDLETLRKYKNKGNIFVETGTHLGNTAAMASAVGFREVYTIELADHFYKRALNRFANDRKVFPIFGDSAVKLKEILSKVTEPCVFWLDGHWSEGDTARGPVDVPLYQELNLIKNHSNKNHTILVDDVRLMGGEWKDISLDKVKTLLLDINPNYQFHYEHGYLDPKLKKTIFKNDILVASI